MKKRREEKRREEKRREEKRREEKRREEKRREEKRREESDYSSKLTLKKKKPYYFGVLEVIKINPAEEENFIINSKEMNVFGDPAGYDGGRRSSTDDSGQTTSDGPIDG